VTGVNDVVANTVDRTVAIRHRTESDDAGYNNVGTVDVVVTATDDDIAGVTLSTDQLSFAENMRGTYTVRLNTKPTGRVTVVPASQDEGVVTVYGVLTFTPDDWNTPQMVAVTGVDDAIINNPHRTAMVTHTVLGRGYDRVVVGSVRVTTTDNDEAGVTLSKAEFSLAEGETETYTVVLNSQPSADVTVTLRSSNPEVAIVAVTVMLTSSDPEAVPALPSLTFTPDDWNTPQTVTVTGLDDTIDNGPAQRRVRITHTVASTDPGYNGRILTNDAIVRDNDTIGVTLSLSQLDIIEDGNGTYTVVLDSQPSGNVTVTPRVRDGEVATVSGPLTFTTANWNRSQTVTVTGVDDTIDNQLVPTTRVTHSISGGGYGGALVADVTVRILDNEGAGVTLSRYSLSVAEADIRDRMATYDVRLKTQPSDNVTIAYLMGTATHSAAHSPFLRARSAGTTWP